VDKDYLTLKRASASRLSGEWGDDDYDVLADGKVVGRIMKVHAAPEGSPWMWTLAFEHHEDRTPTHGYETHARQRWRHSQKAGGGSSSKILRQVRFRLHP
jgi:hypothetical protein